MPSRKTKGRHCRPPEKRKGIPMAFSTRINRYSGFMAVFAACLAAPLLQTAAADVVLPDGYTRLNYIESTDSQYVKTGYKPVWGDRIECKAKIKYPDDDSLLALFGKRDSSDAGHYCFA